MCDECAIADSDPGHHAFNASCLNCMARMISHGHEFWESGRDKEMTDRYRKLLRDTFGSDWKVWHEQVKVWSDRQKRQKSVDR